MFSGSRLGLCWVMICERWEEYKEGVSTYRVQYRKGSVQEGFSTGRVHFREGSVQEGFRTGRVQYRKGSL